MDGAFYFAGKCYSGTRKLKGRIVKLEYFQELLARRRPYQPFELRWPAGSKSPPHDHGNSFGVILVVKGGLYQEVFDKATKLFKVSSTHPKGTGMRETPGVIHVMGNASKTEEAVSVHVYAPALKMTYYDPRIFLRTCGDCDGSGEVANEGAGLMDMSCRKCHGSGKVRYYTP